MSITKGASPKPPAGAPDQSGAAAPTAAAPDAAPVRRSHEPAVHAIGGRLREAFPPGRHSDERADTAMKR